MAKETFSGFQPCVTGKSRSGHCGTATYCPEPYRCCAECLEDCNIRCGWIKGRGRKREEDDRWALG